MSFRSVSSATALLFTILCATLVFFPQPIYWLFGLDPHALGDFMARRAGVLFLGLALIVWLTRETGDPAVQKAICLALAVMMLGLAAMGTFEFARGYAEPGIWLAIVGEITIGAAYVHVWRRTRA
ncbi:hypothetical protein [Asticcacaulis sp. AC402]|uniref:hypothetical protein n=1 Tax=Asticcacaulis sp. AC402 TaxID=1282361 RepID=UPI0003C3E18A|nr:hypothetical protein [Asticcacaulis sp. AC402]ESQ77570.1 hypothetical protein ABAC402_00140 [Asticcacaulis sp. AC402]